MDNIVNGQNRLDSFRQKERQLMAWAPENIQLPRRCTARNAALHPQGADLSLGNSSLDFMSSRIYHFEMDGPIGKEVVVILLIQFLDCLQEAI
jgi:hypothetical protein